MKLNNFTDEEALEIVIRLRDMLPMDYDLSIKKRFENSDALAQVINLAAERIKEKKENVVNK